MLQRTLGSGWGVLLPGVIIRWAGVYRPVSLCAEAVDCIRIATVCADVVSQTITAFCTAAIVYSAYWRHDVGNDELESGMKMKRQRKDKIIGARGGT